jgi:quercetin dioxygenase-like cupin family protein
MTGSHLKSVIERRPKTNGCRVCDPARRRPDFDEFLYVTSGSARVTVRGGPAFTLQKGDVAYFEKGATVDFEFSADFEDVTMLVDDQPVSWR